MFILKVVTDFSSAHSLRNYPGKCAKFHGHNWDIEVSVCSNILNKVGMVIDFKEIKQKVKQVTQKLDHSYLNEVSPFDKINPTAENIAKYIFEEVKELIENENIKLKQVSIWENKDSCATYIHPNQ